MIASTLGNVASNHHLPNSCCSTQVRHQPHSRKGLQEGTWANMVSNVREGGKAQIRHQSVVADHTPANMQHAAFTRSVQGRVHT